MKLLDVINESLAKRPADIVTIELSVNQYRTFCRQLGRKPDPTDPAIDYKNGYIICHKRRGLR